MAIKLKNIKNKSILKKWFQNITISGPVSQSAEFYLSNAPIGEIFLPFQCRLNKLTFTPTADISGSNGTTVSVTNVGNAKTLVSAKVFHSQCALDLDWTGAEILSVSPTLVYEFTALSLLKITVSGTVGTGSVVCLAEFDINAHREE